MRKIFKLSIMFFILFVVGCASQGMVDPAMENPDQVLHRGVRNSSLDGNPELSDTQAQKVQIQKRQIERQKQEINDIKRQRYHDERFKEYEAR